MVLSGGDKCSFKNKTYNNTIENEKKGYAKCLANKKANQEKLNAMSPEEKNAFLKEEKNKQNKQNKKIKFNAMSHEEKAKFLKAENEKKVKAIREKVSNKYSIQEVPKISEFEKLRNELKNLSITDERRQKIRNELNKSYSNRGSINTTYGLSEYDRSMSKIDPKTGLLSRLLGNNVSKGIGATEQQSKNVVRSGTSVPLIERKNPNNTGRNLAYISGTYSNYQEPKQLTREQRKVDSRGVPMNLYDIKKKTGGSVEVTRRFKLDSVKKGSAFEKVSFTAVVSIKPGSTPGSAARKLLTSYCEATKTPKSKVNIIYTIREITREYKKGFHKVYGPYSGKYHMYTNAEKKEAEASGVSFSGKPVVKKLKVN